MRRFDDKCKDVGHYSEMDYSWIVPRTFNVEKASKACQLFLGFHNFASFFKHPDSQRAVGRNINSTLRRISLFQMSKGTK